MHNHPKRHIVFLGDSGDDQEAFEFLKGMKGTKQATGIWVSRTEKPNPVFDITIGRDYRPLVDIVNSA